jgi:hypothetical protein
VEDHDAGAFCSYRFHVHVCDDCCDALGFVEDVTFNLDGELYFGPLAVAMFDHDHEDDE